jgi:hypothetical protein
MGRATSNRVRTLSWRRQASRTNRPRLAGTGPVASWYGDHGAGAGSVVGRADGDQATSERAAVAVAVAVGC